LQQIFDDDELSASALSQNVIGLRWAGQKIISYFVILCSIRDFHEHDVGLHANPHHFIIIFITA